jgi:hypothetical protein
MEHPTEDQGMTLNANRNTIGEHENTTSGEPAASASSETVNRMAAPVVVASFDLKKWLPWIIGALILLLIVWLLSRKRGSGGGGGTAA